MKIKTQLILTETEKKKLEELLSKPYPICQCLDCTSLDCNYCPIDEITDKIEDNLSDMRYLVEKAIIEGE